VWDDLWVVLALLLVLEGVLPAASPRLFRQAIFSVARMDDRALRSGGLISMVLGAVLLYFLKH
jgi:uncharacterized protein YjeT (DUF2065 family)